MNYDINETSILNLNSGYRILDNKSNSSTLINQLSSEEELTNKTSLWFHDVNYYKKLAKGQVLHLSFSHKSSDIRQNYNAINPYYYSIADISNGKSSQLGIIKGNSSVLELKFLNSQRRTVVKSISIFGYSVDSDLNTQLTVDDEFRLYLNSDLITNTVFAGLRGLAAKIDVLKKYNNLSIGADSRVDLVYDSQGLLASPVDYFVNTGVNFNWKVSDADRLNVSLRHSTELRNNNAFLNEVFLANSNTFESFTIDKTRFRTSNLNLLYNHGNLLDDFQFTSTAQLTVFHDYLSDRSLINQEFILKNTINLNNSFSLNNNNIANYYLSSIQHNIKLEADFFRLTYQNYINNSELRDVGLFTQSYNIHITSVFSGHFNYTAGYKWKINHVSFPNGNSVLGNNKLYGSVYFRFNKNFQLESELAYYRVANSLGNVSSFFLGNIKARYDLPYKKMALSLEYRNVTNANNVLNQIITDSFESSVMNQIQGGQLLLSLNYRF